MQKKNQPNYPNYIMLLIDRGGGGGERRAKSGVQGGGYIQMTRKGRGEDIRIEKCTYEAIQWAPCNAQAFWF